MNINRYVILTLFMTISVYWVSAQSGEEFPNFFRMEENVSRNNSQQFLTTFFNMGANDELKVQTQKLDQLGYQHDTYQQFYKGIKVEGGVYKVHSNNGVIQTLNGNFMDINIDIDVNPSLNESTAFQIALNAIGAQKYIWDVEGGSIPGNELVIYADSEGEAAPRLAYKFDIYAVEPLSRNDIFIDAQSGEVIDMYDKIHVNNVPASGESLYDGTVNFTARFTGSSYRLLQTSDGDGIETYDMQNGIIYNDAVEFSSLDDFFNEDPVGVQAHYGAEQTYKYFLQTHGRNSFDDNGSTIKSFVHYNTDYSNAFWNGSAMTYGDGNGVSVLPLVPLDIVGHELAHGVTEFSAGLIYKYESGALNESFSDIFGEAVENFAKGTNNWILGDESFVSEGGIRSMANPNQFNNPDTYLGTFWYAGSGDNGGVHINSGVQNKWFYILTVGEAGTNDLGNSYNVPAIGMEKAAAIAYRNLSVYLTPNAKYPDAREGAIQAAIDLYGVDSPEMVATVNAWYAVGVGDPHPGFDNEPPSTPGNLTASNITQTTFDLSWAASTDNDAVTGYNVYVNDVLVGNTTNLNYSLTELTPNTSYIIYVTAIDATDNESTPAFISVTTLSFDTQAPSNPNNLAISGITQNSANVTWNAATDDVGVTAYKIYVDGNFESSTSNLNYSLSGLSPNTTYDVGVSAIDAADNESGQVTTSFTTLSPTYCISGGNNSSNEWIQSISIGDFSNNSGNNNGYGDFTGQTINLEPGQSYNISLTPGFIQASFNEAWVVWIDYNNDSDFNDANETVFNPGSSTTTINGTINIPGSASGSVRMRIAMQWNQAPGPCGAFPFGEVEDYTVTFEGGNGGDTQAPSTPANLSASNTTENSTELSWNASTDNVGVSAYRVFVDGNLSGTTTSTTYTLSGLAAATTYLVEVSAVDAAANESARASINVTTQNSSDTQAPSTPANLTASNTTENSTELSWDASTDNVGVSAYRVFVDGNLSGTTTSTTYTLSGLAAATTYLMEVSALDLAGNESGRASINLTTEGDSGGPTYCEAQGNVSSFEWIQSVAIGTFSNNSGNNGGYGDYSGQTLNATAGNSYNITLTPGFSGASYAERWRIWIDFNKDGDFSDADELVFDSDFAQANPVNGTINIPGYASGTTRMRIAMKWNGPATPCESFQYGEVEDYSISFSGGSGGDTQVPSAPGNLTASNTSQTSTDLSWNASTDNVGVTGYRVYVDGSMVGTATNTSYNVAGLSAGTTYLMEVSAIDAAANESARASINVTTENSSDSQAPSTPANLTASNTSQTSTDLSWNASTDNVGVTGYRVYVDGSFIGTTANTGYNVTGLSVATTYQMEVSAVDLAGNESGRASISLTTEGDSGGPTYCEAQGDLSSFEWIQSVAIGTFSNNSGNNGGYGDYSGQTMNATAGSSYNITLTPGFSGASYAERWRIWIDFNKDGDFSDADELVFDSGFAQVNPVNGTINIPGYASGTTRMRIAMKWNGPAAPCESFQYGEVEDYSIAFGGTPLSVMDEPAEAARKPELFAISRPNTIKNNGQVLEGVILYPNPVANQLRVLLPQGAEAVRIVGLEGVVIKELTTFEKSNLIDVTDLNSGIYFLQVQTANQVLSRRFIKQ